MIEGEYKNAFLLETRPLRSKVMAVVNGNKAERSKCAMVGQEKEIVVKSRRSSP